MVLVSYKYIITQCIYIMMNNDKYYENNDDNILANLSQSMTLFRNKSWLTPLSLHIAYKKFDNFVF